MGIIITASDDVARTQLLMLSEIISIVARAGDLAGMDISSPPPPTGIGNATWTRITGALAELEAQVAVYRRLGGPELPSNVEQFARDFTRSGTPAKQVVGESTRTLGMLKHFAENFPATTRLGMATVSGRVG